MNWFLSVLIITANTMNYGRIIFSKHSIILTDTIKKTIVKKKIVIYNHKGIRKLGTQSLFYRDDKDSIKIIYARVIKHTGDTINIPDYAINTVLDPNIAQYPGFSMFKIIKIAFIGLEVLDTIEYKVIKYTRDSLNEPGITGIYTFGKDIPVTHSIFSVTLPQKRPLFFKIKGDIHFTKHDSVYTFSKDSIHALVKENASPPDYVLCPSVFYWTDTSASSKLTKIQQAYFKPNIKYQFKNPESVIQNTMLIPLGYDYTGFVPDFTDTSYQNHFITPAQRAFFMLNTDKNAKLIIVLKPYINPNSILIYPFDYILAEVKGRLYNPLNNYGVVGYENIYRRWIYEITRKGWRLKYIHKKVLHSNELNVKTVIDYKKDSVYIEVTPLGFFNNVWQKHVSHFQREDFDRISYRILQQLGSPDDFSDTFENKGNITKPMNIKIRGVIHNIAVSQRKFSVLSLPLWYIYPHYPLTFKQDRKNPAYIRQPYKINFSYAIKNVMPNNFNKNTDLKNKCGYFKRTVKYRHNTLYINVELNVNMTGILNKRALKDLYNLNSRFLDISNGIIVIKNQSNNN